MDKPLCVLAVGEGKMTITRHGRRISNGDLRLFSRWAVNNQIGISFNLLCFIFLTHLIPRARPYTCKFFTLSHRNAFSGKYSNGSDDVNFVAALIVLLTGLRAATIKYLLAPLALGCGIRRGKNLTRFCEQSWLLCYYAVFWTMGVYIYCTSSYWLNMDELWTNWPDRELTGLVKFYVLAQLAFWLQQIIVIHIEERRKDYWQTLSHHFVTCGLIYACYAYHQTRVGNLILIIMDFNDIALPLAKCLKYMGFKVICDVIFGVFLVSWIITRHILFSIVCWSIFADIPRIIGESCWRGSMQTIEGPLPTPTGYGYLLEPFLDSTGLVCFGPTLKWLFLSPLLLLKCMNVAWLVMILRVAAKVVRRQGAEDSRSDDEECEKA